MTERRWIADTWDETTATLTGAEAHHMVRVLRATPGTRAHVVAGGFLWSALVTEVADNKVVFSLEAQLTAERALALTLLVGVFKFDRMEWAIEKATELGVERIAPVVTRRTEKHLAQAAGKRVERWRRIAHEAAQQSRRAEVPIIEAPVALKHALAESRPGTCVLLAETESAWSLMQALSPAPEAVTLAIGPEGGWAAEEVESFRAAGWHPAGLGPRILRVETAAIAALAIAAAAMSGTDHEQQKERRSE